MSTVRRWSVLVGAVIVGLVLLATCAHSDPPPAPSTPPVVDEPTPDPTPAPASPPRTTRVPRLAPSARTARPTPSRITTLPPAPEPYYANCDAVEAAGAAPLYRGELGYRAELDRDGDGVACE